MRTSVDDAFIEWILRDVSLSHRADETAAIVGHTGAGKTTITSLMMRFYDVQRGSILVDGVDVRDMDLNTLRQTLCRRAARPISIHRHRRQQHPARAMTPLRSIRLSRPQMRSTLATSFADLPGAFDEPVRERGNTLSTGQKQLISFARALAANPRILILDEATSSVDTDTEMRVRSALRRMVTGRTSVIIAHRLSTIQRADRILVMHKGQLRETGTHQELLTQRGLYWKLYQLQYKDQELAGANGIAAPIPVSAD